MLKNQTNFKFVRTSIFVAAVLLLLLSVSFFACSQNSGKHIETSYVTESAPSGMKTYDGYTLEHMDVLSRHNIRSPLTGAGSTLDQLTPHQWFD